jgi:hypothetical protein
MLKKKYRVSRLRDILKRYRRGQGLVEFALILPIVLTAFFAIIEIARVYHAWVAVENGARFGVRYAITGELDETKCSGGTCASEAEEEVARVSTVKDVAWAGSQSIIRLAMGSGTNTTSGYFDVTVCEPDDLVGPASQFDTYSCNPSESAGDPGDHVAVVVEYNHPIIVPIISSIVPQIRLTAQRESTVETFREVKSDEGPGSAPPAPQPSLPPPPTPIVTPTQSEPSYDYCANIEWTQTIFWDQSREYDKMWKFAFEFFNNNDIPMYLTDYFVDWTGDVDLKRMRAFEGGGIPSIKIGTKKRSGPAFCYTSGTDHCDPNSNIEFVSRPGCPDDCWPAEIYNMFCKDYGMCNYNEPWSTNTNYVITDSNYTFSAEAVFTFYPSGEPALDCPHSWSASGNAPDHFGGGESTYNPPAPPEPTEEGGGGGDGGGEEPTPDPNPPGD